MEIVTDMLSNPPGGIHEDPDHDFYQKRWFRSLVTLILFGIVVITIFVLFVPTLGSHSRGAHLTYLIPTYNFVTWLPISSVLGIGSYILFSLLLKDMFTLKGKALLMSVNIIFAFVYISGPLLMEFVSFFGFDICVAIYAGLSLYYIRCAPAAR
jgi:hypothetical protein